MAVAQEYVFGPAVRLRIRGPAPARRHFEREFGPPAALGAAPDVDADIRFGRPSSDGAQIRGGHKTARWGVSLGDPQERPLRLRITLLGGPPSFALSLVQGYFVEPAIALALSRSGSVALPSAAIVGGDGASVLMGRSGSGKSSVSVRALARGLSILGDDQVLIAADGGCWPYPRRLRLYPDIRQTAPEAWPRLAPATRRTLVLRQVVRRATRGYVAPSLAVPVAEVGTAPGAGRVRAARLTVVERSGDVHTLSETQRDAEWATREAVDVLADQRARLAAAADARWRSALEDAAEREATIVRAWLGGLPVTQLRIPRAWTAPVAVRALASQLGLDG